MYLENVWCVSVCVRISPCLLSDRALGDAKFICVWVFHYQKDFGKFQGIETAATKAINGLEKRRRIKN